MATTNDRTIEANGSPSSLMEGTDLFMMTDSNGSFKRASVSDMVDALKKLGAVNGRNLVKGSAVPLESDKYSMSSWLWGDARPELGQQVTVTIWGELGSDRTNFTAFNSNGDGTNGMVQMGQEIAPGVYSGVITLKQWNKVNGISIYQMPQTGTSVSRIDRVKVELGTIATDWTPAPEDNADLLTENRGG